MKRRIGNLMISLLRMIEDRFGYRKPKAYGMFPSNMKTTFRRD